MRPPLLRAWVRPCVRRCDLCRAGLYRLLSALRAPFWVGVRRDTMDKNLSGFRLILMSVIQALALFLPTTALSNAGTAAAAASRHHVGIVLQPVVHKRGQYIVHRAAGLGYDSYPGPVERHLQRPGNRPADDGPSSQQADRPGPFPGVEAGQRTHLPPQFPPAGRFNDDQAGRFIENRGNTPLPNGNRDLHRFWLSCESIKDAGGAGSGRGSVERRPIVSGAGSPVVPYARVHRTDGE